LVLHSSRVCGKYLGSDLCLRFVEYHGKDWLIRLIAEPCRLLQKHQVIHWVHGGDGLVRKKGEVARITLIEPANLVPDQPLLQGDCLSSPFT
jgi:hypothetical protein